MKIVSVDTEPANAPWREPRPARCRGVNELLAVRVVCLVHSSGSPQLSTSPPSRITWRQFAGLGLTTFILLGVLVHSTLQSWQQHEHQHIERASGFARAVASHLGLILRGIEGDLRALGDSLAQDSVNLRQGDTTLAAYAARHANARALLVFDASGALAASSASDHSLDAISVDLDSLSKHREDRGATFRISAPFVLPSSDERLVIATLGVHSSTGSLVGIVGALLSAPQFLGELTSLKPSHLTRLTVVRSDGQYLMRIPAFQPGMRLTASRSSTLWKALEDARILTQTVSSPEDGLAVFAAFRRIDGFPLFVAVTIKKSAIQAEWWRANTEELLAYGLLTLAALAANVIVFRRLRHAAGVALRQSQASLVLTEARFRDAADSLQDGISLWDADGKLVLWNARYAELYPTIRDHLRVGVSFAELTEIYVRGISSTDDLVAQEQRLATYTRRFLGAVGDDSYGAPNDRIVDVTRARTAEGGVVSLHRDVTLQRRTTAALSASDALFRDAMESLGEGLTIWDSDDRLVLWNRRYLELTPQMEPHLRAGASFAELYAIVVDLEAPALSQQERARRIAKRLAARGNSTTPFDLNGLNGMKIEVSERRTSSGGIVSVYRDVTDARHLLERLQASESELQRALVAEREMNAQQRRFISIASHEFRTPLAIIDSTAQRIQARMEAAEDRNADMLKRMDRIRGSVSRMTDIIDRTLTTARLDEGRFEFEPASLDLGKLLHDVVARQRSIVPSFEIEIALPATAVMVTADAKLLELVFANIISNAVKYSGKSRRIEVTVARGDESVTIEVRDHGIGVPQDELEKLFTRFYRASTAQGIPGTGIGLHLANELVQMHGGRIDVFSELGRGSCFVVLLPRDAARRDAAA